MERLIRSLKSPNLSAKCPSCGDTFLMSDAILFDGTKLFLHEAEPRRDESEQRFRLSTWSARCGSLVLEHQKISNYGIFQMEKYRAVGSSKSSILCLCPFS